MAKIEIYRSEPETMEAKYLTVCAKVSDCFGGELINENNEDVYHYDGYVPTDLGIGGGDYIEFKLNLDTGQIMNWKPLTSITIEES